MLTMPTAICQHTPHGVLFGVEQVLTVWAKSQFDCGARGEEQDASCCCLLQKPTSMCTIGTHQICYASVAAAHQTNPWRLACWVVSVQKHRDGQQFNQTIALVRASNDEKHTAYFAISRNNDQTAIKTKINRPWHCGGVALHHH